MNSHSTTQNQSSSETQERFDQIYDEWLEWCKTAPPCRSVKEALGWSQGLDPEFEFEMEVAKIIHGIDFRAKLDEFLEKMKHA